MKIEYQIKRIKNLLLEAAKSNFKIIGNKEKIKDILFYNWLKNTKDKEEVRDMIESDLYESDGLKRLKKEKLIEVEDDKNTKRYT